MKVVAARSGAGMGEERSELLKSVAFLNEDVAEVFGADGPCPSSVEYGHPRFVLVTGDNAGGKSFFARHIGVYLDEFDGKKVELIPVDMHMRTMSGMHRVFMFGEEGRDSTGKISIGAVLGGLRTCEGREGAHVLVLDEPDIGLSEPYQKALGQRLAQFVEAMPEKTLGLVVVTHSRALVSEVVHLDPTSVRIGEDQRPVREWLRTGSLPKSVEDLENLGKLSTERMRAINRALAERRGEDDAQNPKP